MMIFDGKRILFIGAHIDDIELGCGGLISKLKGLANIYFLCLTDNRKDSNGNIQEVRDLNELFASAAFLGVPKDNVLVFKGADGQLFPECRQQILEELYRVGDVIKPDIIFFTDNDVHHDHVVTYSSALKAFKRKTCISYEVYNSTLSFTPNMYIELSDHDIGTKIEAIQYYNSQKDTKNTPGDYFEPEKIKALAIFRGVRIGAPFAESFKIINYIL